MIKLKHDIIRGFILFTVFSLLCEYSEATTILDSTSEIILPITSTPQVTDNILYIGLSAGKVYAIDKISGKQFWVYQNPERHSFLSKPIIYNNLVVVVDEKGIVSALDLKNGKTKWSINTGQRQITYTGIIDGVMIAGSSNSLYAIDIIKRKVIWVFSKLDNMEIMLSRPIFNNGKILSSSWVSKLNKSYLIFIDSKTGNILNKINIGSDIRLTAPYVIGRRILLGSTNDWLSSPNRENGSIFLYNESSGKIEFILTNSGAIPDYSLLVGYKDTLFFVSFDGLSQHKEGYFYRRIYVNALDIAIGKVRWKHKIGEYSFAVIGICDDEIFAGGADENIYVLDSNEGKVIWQFPVKGRIRSDFVCDNNAVYFRTDSSLYAADLSQKKILWEKELD